VAVTTAVVETRGAGECANVHAPFVFGVAARAGPQDEELPRSQRERASTEQRASERSQARAQERMPRHGSKKRQRRIRVPWRHPFLEGCLNIGGVRGASGAMRGTMVANLRCYVLCSTGRRRQAVAIIFCSNGPSRTVGPTTASKSAAYTHYGRRRWGGTIRRRGWTNRLTHSTSSHTA